MSKLLKFCISSLALLSIPCVLSASPVESMRVEGLSGWVVTDDPAPRMEWTPCGHGIAKWELQAAFGNDEYSAAKTWKPEIFDATEGPWKVWNGGELKDRQQIRWRVRAIDTDGKEGPWSSDHYFERGIPGEWKTPWIGMDPAKRGQAAPLFRKEFNWDGKTEDTRLYISGLGYHEAWLNGIRLGEGVLEPGQTDYEQRVFYVVHNLEQIIKEGPNVLAVRVGDGFYNQNKVWGPNGMSYGQPKLSARLMGKDSAGKTKEITSDTSWKCTTGAILSSNIYHGEIYDAQKSVSDWKEAGFDDSNWETVIKMSEPGGVMEAESLPPIMRQTPLEPKIITEPEPGITVYNFGQNFTGWCRIKVEAPAGTKITMTFSERLGEDGMIDTLSTGTIHTKAEQTDVYTCKGGEIEIWEPSFSWHGFQFVEVRIENGDPKTLELTGIPVHTRMDVIGDFKCSDPLINRLLDTAHWTQVSNVLSLPMDCPARERCGWTGDAHLCVPFTMYRYDTTAMWRKYTKDILTTAERATPMLTFGVGMGDRKVRPKAKGIPTMVAPGKRYIGEASPDWGSAVVFIPWDVYLFSGDERVLARNLGPMRQWTKHVENLANEDGIVNAGLGDWCRPWPSTGKDANLNTRGEAREYYGEVIPMLSTACLFRCAEILEKSETIAGDPAKAVEWRALAEKTRKAFFLAVEQNNGWSYQTVMAIALEWGLAPEDQEQKIADRLAQQVAKDNNHFMTGVFGAPSLWPALADHGHEQVARRILDVKTAPSFHYLFEQGATSFWEVWPGEVDKGQPWERSMSHPFHGAFAHWFYSGLAGIRQDGPGFSSIRLQPVMTRQMDSIDCRFRSAMGWIGSSWKQQGDRLIWNVEIPPGSTATIAPPGNMEVWDFEGKSMEVENDNSEFQILPGHHIFTISLK